MLLLYILLIWNGLTLFTQVSFEIHKDSYASRCLRSTTSYDLIGMSLNLSIPCSWKYG
ncbi:hypothetical protein PF005_g28264 [Phytophthora fragariae]|uniref:Uncharacterized protein n=1 Tax=Phytophthora fragariae TaxID=53985 RepID=A0A6A3PV15_9STRA|nr:hypothetical protein PF003_g2460 [Phytophthora fragariae]KAE8921225.1 hypothetical protein PF009_g28491 [Phytophthora fragariae]KAE9059268.1 hypothetical protein PF007_g31012 [Phytophthora fragariae]KAE9059671.1 hypothetical protein PF006_g31825 [Phytophthora fragariae]KAE9168701.1 hypothetical protein PF005_g28264 [Phytophthora fragariae]